MLGTGYEDFFDSAYWFGAASGFPQTAVPFAHRDAGLLFFSRNDSLERLSTYRSFSQDVFGFDNGGSLQWRVGDQHSKCTTNGSDNVIGKPASVTLSAYSWILHWPNGQPTPPPTPAPSPPPPGPPAEIGCADGTCEGFCANSHIR